METVANNFAYNEIKNWLKTLNIDIMIKHERVVYSGTGVGMNYHSLSGSQK